MSDKRVLLIEDEPMVARLFQREAESSDFRIEIAANGIEARRLADRADFDVVVSDIHLPGESGIDLAQSFLTKNPDLPFLFVTADSDVTIPAGEVLDRVRGLILKPWAHGDVKRALESCIDPTGPLHVAAPRTLVIEDSITDVILLQDAIMASQIALHIEHVDRLSLGTTRLNNEKWDLVITDLNLPDGRGVDAVRRLLAHCDQVPLLVLTATDSWELAQECVRLGAQDYLLKDELAGITLARAVRNAFERKRTEAELFRLAHYDSLTNIGNRHYFRSRLRHAVQRAHRRGSTFAVLFADLDRFKEVNDRHGHDAGDRVLQMVASRLTEVVRKVDSVARLAGDEFAILLEDAPSDRYVEDVVTRIRDLLSKPISIVHSEIEISASIGMARYPRDGRDVDDLLKFADHQMYASKHHAVQTAAKLNGSLEPVLERALALDEFELYYQPQVQVAGGKIVSAEALLRLPTEQGRTMTTRAMIDELERTGLMEPVGEWILQQACLALSRWQQLGHELRMGVNVSPKQILSPGLFGVLDSALTESGIRANALELEITESVLLDRPDRARDEFSAIRGLGCGLAIDDFGTGYSSFSYLHQYPFTSLKIDRGLVRSLETSRRARTLVRSVTELGHNLGLEVVAEGVETDEQLNLLRGWSCERTQGYLHAEPIPEDEFLDLLETENSSP